MAPSGQQNDTVAIPLTRGKVAWIDKADLALVGRYTWHLCPDGRLYYAITNFVRPDGSPTTLQMHRIILDAPPDMQCDHIDCDGLNNTRANLRLATRAQNMHNRRTNKNSVSGLKGVSFIARLGKFRARIRVNGTQFYLGLFDTAEAAHAAYREAAFRYFGEFARDH